jgi:hypothetical protein
LPAKTMVAHGRAATLRVSGQSAASLFTCFTAVSNTEPVIDWHSQSTTRLHSPAANPVARWQWMHDHTTQQRVILLIQIYLSRCLEPRDNNIRYHGNAYSLSPLLSNRTVKSHYYGNVRPALCHFKATHTALTLTATKSSGHHSCFVFGRSQVQISAKRLAILTEGFCGFPQSLQAKAVIALSN